MTRSYNMYGWTLLCYNPERRPITKLLAALVEARLFPSPRGFLLAQLAGEGANGGAFPSLRVGRKFYCHARAST